MVAQEQNRMIDITKFTDNNYECYINPKYISRIFKTKYDDYYNVCVGEITIALCSVKTKQQLNEFLDYIYSR